MGYLYRRGSRIWLGYHDADGRLKQLSTGLPLAQEETARAMLERIEAGAAKDLAPAPQTVRQYERRWAQDRKTQGVASAEDESARLHLHAMPAIGHLRLDEVRPRHIRDLVRGLRAKGSMAPRSIRHVYGALRTLFRDAVVDELIPSSPCVLKRADLPKSADQDPTWRASAVFERSELDRLLTDERVPADRRALYALLGLGGLRFGEASALRWKSYDAGLEPLGRLVITSSWCTLARIEKAPKSGQPRMVPVHPALADMLAAWNRDGWPAMMGRAPGPDDLIVPSRRGAHRGRHHSLDKFHEDLVRLGLRRRRQHDLRRTFVSLCLSDGARKDVLRWVSHGPTGDVVDQYTTLPWASVCAEVARLRVDLKATPAARRQATVAGADDAAAAA